MSDKKNFLDDINNKKPESFQEEQFIKQKKNLMPSIILSTALIIITVVLLAIFLRSTSIPDMDGWKSADVKTWADKNNVIVVMKEDYSDTVDSGIVIETKPAADVKVKRNGTLTVSVSRGADPNEEIQFPDIKNMNLPEINEWVVSNKLSGITIRKENSTVFSKDSVIDFEVIDGNESNFIRKNRVTVYISIGPKILDNTVSVPDFSGQEKTGVQKWAADNNISVVFREVFNGYVENGRVISQSIERNTKMNRTDVIEITMSLGEAANVPDFIGMTQTAAGNTADFKSVKIRFVKAISNKTEGTVIDQDIAIGSIIHSKQIVTLTVASKSEEVTVPDFTGMKSSDVGIIAGLKDIKTVFMDRINQEPAGTVVGQSYQAGSVIDRVETVILYVSSGNVMIPDFGVMTQSELDLWRQVNGVSVTVAEQYSDKYQAGEFFNQNFINQLLPTNETLIIYRSLGKVAVRDFSGQSKLDVIDWQQEVNGKGADITLKFHITEVLGEEGNKVVNQSVKGDYTAAKSRLDIWITADRVTEIPDMTAVGTADFISWCNLNKVPYKIVEQYSSEYNKDVLFGQNYTNMALPQGSELVIYKSLGKPKVIKLGGYTEIEAEGWINTMNLLGAKLTIEYGYQHSDGVREGSVVSQNPLNKWVDVGSVLKIYLSIGPDN